MSRAMTRPRNFLSAIQREQARAMFIPSHRAGTDPAYGGEILGPPDGAESVESLDSIVIPGPIRKERGRDPQ